MVRVLLLFALGTATANATLITIDANSYSAGTDISAIHANATLSTLFMPLLRSHEEVPYAPQRSAVLIESCGASGCPGDGGNRIGAAYFNAYDYLGCFQTGFGHSCAEGFQVLEVTFANPVRFVNVQSLGYSDHPEMYVYNTLGNLVALCRDFQPCMTSSRVGADRADSLVITSTSRDIARVVYGGYSGSAHVTSISYSVPEPSTLALLLGGLLGIRLSRRTLRQS